MSIFMPYYRLPFFHTRSIVYGHLSRMARQQGFLRLEVFGRGFGFGFGFGFIAITITSSLSRRDRCFDERERHRVAATVTPVVDHHVDLTRVG